MISRKLVLVMLAAAAAVAVGEEPNPTSRRIVHTQLVTSNQLAPDPRGEGRMNVIPGPEWMSFDRNGYLAEIAMKAENGKGLHIQRHKLDGRGRPLETTVNEAAAGTRTEYKDGPFGAVEQNEYDGDRLLRKTLFQYDSHGRCLSTEVLNGDGQPISAVNYTYDAQGRSTQVVTRTWDGASPEPSTYYRHDESYDSDGNLRQHVEYDRNGEAIRSISFDPGLQVSTWWQKAETTFAQPMYAGRYDPQTRINTNYEVTPAGKLFKTVQEHRDADDVDLMQRFDEAGTLVEKVSVRYERDQYGNWVRRTLSAWDANTNTMVDVREDVRTLTYY